MSVIGLSGSHRMRVAASATRGYAGEPVYSDATYTTSVATTNTVIVLADAKTVIGTDVFGGILASDMVVNTAGTVIASKVTVSVPIPYITRVRGKLKTASVGDTDTEILGLLWDIAHIDLTGTAYTFETGGADTGMFVIRDGNPAKSTVDCVIDARAYRVDIS